MGAANLLGVARLKLSTTQIALSVRPAANANRWLDLWLRLRL